MRTSWPIWRSVIADHPVEWIPSSPLLLSWPPHTLSDSADIRLAGGISMIAERLASVEWDNSRQ
jgi:hypothetical protein